MHTTDEINNNKAEANIVQQFKSLGVLYKQVIPITRSSQVFDLNLINNGAIPVIAATNERTNAGITPGEPEM